MNKLPFGLCCAALLVGATFGLGACGASAAMEVPKSVSPQPATVDEALANLNQAEGDIDRVLGAGSPGSGQPGYAQPPAQAAPAEPLGGAAPPPPAPPTTAGAPDKMEAEADPCATACRALASMGRAAEHLCGLAGESDMRCDGARGRVQAASQRVHASCPSCSS